MAARLSPASLERALEHVCHYGDTDVFPHLFETAFLKDEKVHVIEELAQLDLDSFSPSQGIETIAPKSRYGFRVVHQLPLLETVLFTASLIEIAPNLAAGKGTYGGYGPFAYHFNANGGSSLFEEGRTYHDWLQWQKQELLRNDFHSVIHTDIADFYQRIYFHRVENTINNLSPNAGVNRYILKAIKAIRSHQSYGIPIGGSASRLLAEAVLIDLDAALFDEGIIFSRFVDDYRIFIRSDQDSYQVLSRLAELLYSSEGLTLNGQKTSVHNGSTYLTDNVEIFKSAGEKAEETAIETLSSLLYFDENPNQELVDQLRNLNLVGMLQEEIESESWNFSRIKSVLRALRLSGSDDAVEFVIANLRDLLPFSKEILLYFDELKMHGVDFGPDLPNKLIEVAGNSSSPVATTKTWILEFFVRGICEINNQQVRILEESGPLIERQITLIRGLRGENTFFRRNKNDFDHKSSFTKPAFMLAATCLTTDELSTWLSAVRPRLTRPLDNAFSRWVAKKSGKLREVLDSSRVATPDA